MMLYCAETREPVKATKLARKIEVCMLKMMVDVCYVCLFVQMLCLDRCLRGEEEEKKVPRFSQKMAMMMS